MVRTPQCRRALLCLGVPGQSLLRCFSVKAKRRIVPEAALGICKLLKCVKRKLLGHVTTWSGLDVLSYAAEPRRRAAQTGQGDTDGRVWGCPRGCSYRAAHPGWSFAAGQHVTLHSKSAPSVSPPPCRKQSEAVGIRSQRRVSTRGAGSSALASAPLTPLGKSHSLKCELFFPRRINRC